MSESQNSISRIQTSGSGASAIAEVHSDHDRVSGVQDSSGNIEGAVQADLSGFAAKSWIPHNYQTRAVNWLTVRPEAALFLPPGMGKTSCSLSAFLNLRSMGYAKRMLIVAPKKVCESTWPAEIQKWYQFQSLSCVFAHGPMREEALLGKADIVLLNYDGLVWATKLLKPGMFEVVLFDELTKLKNHRSKRYEYIKPVLPLFKFRWGLTGTPAANGLIDLFGQMLVLDLGRRLGRYVTHYRAKFFHQKPFDDYNWYITPEKQAYLIKHIEDMAMYMDPKDYLDMPELINVTLPVALDKDTRAQYEELEDQFFLKVQDGVVTAANAGVLTSKLRQFTGGAVYDIDRNVVDVHTAKLDALDELVDELAGSPLMVAYMFEHELERLLQRHPKALVLKGGMTGMATKYVVEAWNSGYHPLLFVQPSSAAHGLNLQFGGSNICWFTLTYNMEEYQQLIARIYRQGQGSRVFNYILAAEKTCDARVAQVLAAKDTVQEDLFKALVQK